MSQVPDEQALKRKPLLLSLSLPLPSRLRFYISHATSHASERQQGIYKIQLTCGTPVAPTRARQEGKRSVRLCFDRTGDVRPILLGYQSDWNLFILWDADLHDARGGFPYSKSVQVHPDVVKQASVNGLANGTRKLHGRDLFETIIAAKPRRLVDALQHRIRLSNDAMIEGLF